MEMKVYQPTDAEKLRIDLKRSYIPNLAKATEVGMLDGAIAYAIEHNTTIEVKGGHVYTPECDNQGGFVIVKGSYRGIYDGRIKMKDWTPLGLDAVHGYLG